MRFDLGRRFPALSNTQVVQVGVDFTLQKKNSTKPHKKINPQPHKNINPKDKRNHHQNCVIKHQRRSISTVINISKSCALHWRIYVYFSEKKEWR